MNGRTETSLRCRPGSYRGGHRDGTTASEHRDTCAHSARSKNRGDSRRTPEGCYDVAPTVQKHYYALTAATSKGSAFPTGGAKVQVAAVCFLFFPMLAFPAIDHVGSEYHGTSFLETHPSLRLFLVRSTQSCNRAFIFTEVSKERKNEEVNSVFGIFAPLEHCTTTGLSPHVCGEG